MKKKHTYEVRRRSLERQNARKRERDRNKKRKD